MEVPRMEDALNVPGTVDALHVPGMEEAEKVGSHLTSAAAFVEGGIQDACDDACSICLEEFCESDPSTVTSCKHEFHLQCILEWCQRSSQCPMCWQAISLKDPTSQELLEAVERERNIRFTPSRNATIFHHPTLGDFELQHVPMGTNDPELEERIIQHLAAAAAMGRAHHFSRREGQRSRSSAHGRPQFLVFSTHPNAPPTGPVSGSPAQVGEETEPASRSIPLTTTGDEASQQIRLLPSVQTDRRPALASGSAVIRIDRQGTSFHNRSSSSLSSSPNQDRAGPSEFQSISETLKSRFNAMSMRYKDSIAKSTKGWKERLFSRSSSAADLGPEVPSKVNAGIASVSRMMERPETGEDSTTNCASVADRLEDHSVTEQSNQNEGGNSGEIPLNDSNMPSSYAASSAST